MGCNLTFELQRPAAQRNDYTPCPQCGYASKKMLSTPGSIGVKHSTVKDARGTPIWFPEDGKPYHDRQLGKTFNNIDEKKKHMDSKGIVMDGSTGGKKKDGWKRNKDYV